jgi:hypothetical protein
MIIEDSQAKFDVNILGNIHKQTYMGNFKVKCVLSPLDYINADKLYRDLLGDNMAMASDRAKNLAFALSQLKYRVIEAPAFWEHRELGGAHIEDDNVIMSILELAIEAEQKYMSKKDKEAEEIEKRLTKALKTGRIQKQPELDQNDGIPDSELPEL